MVAAANPLAVKAGCDVLKSGGSAVDAAVAVQAARAVRSRTTAMKAFDYPAIVPMGKDPARD